MPRLGTLTAAFATALALACPSVARAARCGVPESMRSAHPGVARISATDVDCDVARDVARGIIRRHRAGMPIASDLGRPQPTFTVRAVRRDWRGRYTCRGRYVELNPDGDLAYELRCAQRRRVIRVRLYS
jgi:hypothetical protein